MRHVAREASVIQHWACAVLCWACAVAVWGITMATPCQQEKTIVIVEKQRRCTCCYVDHLCRLRTDLNWDHMSFWIHGTRVSMCFVACRNKYGNVGLNNKYIATEILLYLIVAKSTEVKIKNCISNIGPTSRNKKHWKEKMSLFQWTKYTWMHLYTTAWQLL